MEDMMNGQNSARAMGPLRVLVFPGGTEIGLEIYRSLVYSKNIELFGATSLDRDVGCALFENYFTGLPFIDDPRFLETFINLLESWLIDFVYPAHDAVCLYLSQNRDSIPAKVLTSSYDTCFVCRNKRKTYEYFKEIIPVPKVYASENEVDKFPVFVKPEVGEASRGAMRIDSLVELRHVLQKMGNILVLEYLPGEEYTIDCFTNFRGELLFLGVRKRIRTSGGISTYTRIGDRHEFSQYANKINEKLKLRGAWFFQMKRDEGGNLVLMEIAPRVSGGMGLFRNRGVNLPLLTIYDALGVEVKILENMDFPAEMFRSLSNYPLESFSGEFRYSQVYIDFDDTLVVKGKLNPLLVLFIVQCRNRGIPIYLLTRHRGNVLSELDSLGIRDLIDNIIHLGEKEKKSSKIVGESPILVDDSFAEREEVMTTLNIPTFGVEMIESLIDWRMS
ncbi:MAG: ATP-grasp domain-containing protein [Candidatus Hydrogenedentes bacterium]|nr:ATP-grasp domain-containing protein [Candidatus Hydrogenedentota bacterium]